MIMENPKILSGEELVARGVTKTFATLPEIGIKDVTPNGSWLEQKQIQSSLEARKHLIEVERIEKLGTLSQAEWRDDLKLAEVTKQTGSYWQFFGHNIGKKLYLRCEEALFLIEVNCLQLKHNEVTMSLQKAYSLLLSEEFTLNQYKVYASLSRLGYKVFRHIEIKKANKKGNQPESVAGSSSKDIYTDICNRSEETGNPPSDYDSDNDEMSTVNSEILQNNNSGEKKMDVSEGGSEAVSQDTGSTSSSKLENSNNKNNKYEMKIQKLKSRKLRSVKDFHQFFEELPAMAKYNIVYLNTPEGYCLPSNVIVRKSSYKINQKRVRTRNYRSSSTESSSDEEERMLRRLEAVKRKTTPNPNFRPPTIMQQFRPFLFWRPLNRSTLMNQFLPRSNYNPSSNADLRPSLDSNDDNHNSANRALKRTNYAKRLSLQTIQNLALKVKNDILSGNIVMAENNHTESIQALNVLLHTYNLDYCTKLRLTPQFDLVEEPNAVETIELDVDEETQRKKPRLEEDTFSKNFYKLRLMGQRLRNLEANGISTSRHKRALSNAIKTFNKSYNSDIFLNDNYEMIDRRHIMLDSNSESESVVKDIKKQHKKKKLRNPFYISKKKTETTSNGNASTSKDYPMSEVEQTAKAVPKIESCDNQFTLDRISADWLPKENTFCKVEVCRKDGVNRCMVNSCEDELLYDFVKSHANNYEDWYETKIAFTEYLKEMNKLYDVEHNNIKAMMFENLSRLRSIIGPDDYSDMPTLLKKLRIIKNHSIRRAAESNIKIDFDVYNRDVPNFRKSKLPKPHFRVVCVEDSSKLPPGKDITSLHTKYDDKIPTVFAIEGVGCVSYLQINTVELPVCVTSTVQ